MAAAGVAVKDLCEEATCSICLDFFKDPVTITECGHSFCQACLAQCWGKSDTETCCPQCRETIRERNSRPNWQLANIVEIAKKLQESSVLQEARGAEGKGRVCAKHQEPLKLFCKDHETLICLVCDRSKEHEDHQAIPLEEASQEYTEKVHHFLELLKKEREKILSHKADTTKESQDLLKQMEAERQKTVAEFGKLRQLLEEQEKFLLAQMEEVEKEIGRKRAVHAAILSRELSSLESLIREMEEKCQQPVTELLQDCGSILQKCQRKQLFLNPVAFSPALKWRIWEFCDINAFLEGVRKQLKGTLISGLQLQKANVTLDPDTAHPKLILPEDRKSVKLADKAQDLLYSPYRFNTYTFVLGCEGFTAGRHCWEVFVGSEGEWSIGVARKSVKRKGEFESGPEEGIWDMGMWGEAHSSLFPREGSLWPLLQAGLLLSLGEGKLAPLCCPVEVKPWMPRAPGRGFSMKRLVQSASNTLRIH
ncbi:E3 ubiquitin-protein ligase TRIM7-like isoform X2 [Hemicordylus capensis]|uniref:E3 ubiquitin-protein ligase TRIM7-like isoform X2 n=1 Tax=Hemicordylus capensis TaxID=884348 RepID=UPI002303BC39|nr:E3 ubiquitin-protein ligase TRIM7-like isoform X2 [Hemicordylus capensis]